MHNALDVEELLYNVQLQLPYLTTFVTAFCYLSGFFFAFRALYRLKEYGEMRTMMASQTDLRVPFAILALGVALIFSPHAIKVGLTSIYGTGTLMEYEGRSSSWSLMGETIVAVVQFVGGVAFLRGLFILHKASTQPGQPGTFAKAMTHLLGGVVALNIVQTVHIFFNSLGI